MARGQGAEALEFGVEVITGMLRFGPMVRQTGATGIVLPPSVQWHRAAKVRRGGLVRQVMCQKGVGLTRLYPLDRSGGAGKG